MMHYAIMVIGALYLYRMESGASFNVYYSFKLFEIL